jgi:hypothetical protein
MIRNSIWNGTNCQSNQSGQRLQSRFLLKTVISGGMIRRKARNLFSEQISKLVQ